MNDNIAYGSPDMCIGCNNAIPQKHRVEWRKYHRGNSEIIFINCCFTCYSRIKYLNNDGIPYFFADHEDEFMENIYSLFLDI